MAKMFKLKKMDTTPCLSFVLGARGQGILNGILESRSSSDVLLQHPMGSTSWGRGHCDPSHGTLRSSQKSSGPLMLAALEGEHLASFQVQQERHPPPQPQLPSRHGKLGVSCPCSFQRLSPLQRLSPWPWPWQLSTLQRLSPLLWISCQVCSQPLPLLWPSP